MIPSFRPSLSRVDFIHIRDILRTGRIVAGPWTARLETAVAGSIGKRKGLACASGTSALHLALRALGVGPGDRVLIPSFTCAAVLHAVRHAGAEPAVMDVDPATLNPSPADASRAAVRRTKAIILAHSSGHPSVIEDFHGLGLPIIEDCCLAAGARVDGRPVGSRGEAAVFSFHATKPACAGAGGLAAASTARVAARLRDLASSDMRADDTECFSVPMSDLTAGLALSQWHHLPIFLRRRRELAQRYRAELGPVCTVPADVPGAEPSYHHFLVRVRNAGRFVEECRRAGVDCDRPVHKPLHRYLGLVRSGADESWRRWACIPLYPALTERQVRTVLNTVRPILARSV